MIDDLGVARAVHLLAIVHWIGGMAVVTTIVLPHAKSFPDADADAALGAFEAFERRFAQQVRISILLTGMSGIYMIWRLAAWERFRSFFVLVAGPHGGSLDSVRIDALRDRAVVDG
jgi:uncharacterized membrane protein